MGKKLFLFAAAAVALASCTETDLSGDTSFAKESTSDAIQFSAKAGNSGVTRAEVAQNYTSGTIGNVTNSTKGLTDLKNARFGVFAYYTGAGNYDPAQVGSDPSNIEPNFMYNQEIKFDDATSDGKNAWIYSPVKYWPNGIDADNLNTEPSHTAAEKQAGKVSFFAYAPYKSVDFFDAAYEAASDGTLPTGLADATTKKNTAATNGIKAMTTNEFTGNVWVKYLMPNAKQSEAVDLLWGLAGKAKYDEADGEDPAFTIGKDYNLNLTKQKVDERVSFLFKHALAKVGGATTETETTTGAPAQCGFKVIADIDKNDGDAQDKYFPASFKPEETLVTIKEVKIQDGASAATEGNAASGTKSNFNTFGWFNIETGQWCNDPNTYGNNGTGATYNITVNNDKTLTDDTQYLLNEEILEIGAKKNGAVGDGKEIASGGTTWTSGTKPSGVKATEALPLFANENVPGLLVIPGGNGNELYITVDYFVRTADKNLKEGFTQVEQIITNKVSLGDLDPNKYYTIIMHLGLTSVKFEAKVTDWTLTDDATFDENGNVTEGVDKNEESVWLPSNVVSANQWAISPASLSFKAMGQSISLTSVTMNGGSALAYQAAADESHYSLSVVGSPAPAWLSIESDGKVKAEPNTNIAKRTAAVNVSTIVNGNTITTPITVEQEGYTFNLTQAAGVVTVKDGDNQDVTNLTATPTWTVVVYDSNGATVANTHYTIDNAAGTVTITGANGTYTVKVTYKDSADKTVTKTIETTKS